MEKNIGTMGTFGICFSIRGGFNGKRKTRMFQLAMFEYRRVDGHPDCSTPVKSAFRKAAHGMAGWFQPSFSFPFYNPSDSPWFSHLGIHLSLRL